jgi:hypothetical protein
MRRTITMNASDITEDIATISQIVHQDAGRA